MRHVREHIILSGTMFLHFGLADASFAGINCE